MKPSTRFWGKVVGITLLCLLFVSSIWFGVNFVSNVRTHMPSVQTVAPSASIATSFREPYDSSDPGYNYSSGYEYGQQTTLHGKHKGADINWGVGGNADEGKSVFAVANGRVIFAGLVSGGYGNSVRIEHTLPDGSSICSFYSHLGSINVSIGAISVGDLLGTIGKTGLGPDGNAHLHWEMETDCSWHDTQTTEVLNRYYVNPKEFVDNFNYYARISDRIVLFDNTFLRGFSQSVYPGNANFEIANASSFDNMASSLSMPPGWSAFLYDHPGDAASAYVASTDQKLSDNAVSDGSGSIDNRTSALTVYTTNQCGSVAAASVEAASIANNCNPSPSPNPGPDPEPEPVGAPQDPGKRLIMFSQQDYVGTLYELGLGYWDVEDREYLSISIPDGWSFILHDSQDGHESCYARSLNKLTDHESWQFHIGSLAVYDKNVCSTAGSDPNPNPGGQVTIYKQRHFSDPYRSFGPGFWDIENREYNSIKIPDGWSFILNDSRDGHESCYNFSLDALTDHESWQFNIDTIYIEARDLCGGGGSGIEPMGTAAIRLFRGAGHTREYVTLNYATDYNILWTPSFKFGEGAADFNDGIESFDLNTDIVGAVAFYEHDELGGGATCFTGSELDLRTKTFDNGLGVANQASSARYFLDGVCDLRPAAPTEIWIHESSKSEVKITWNASTPDVAGYRIYRYENNAYTLVGEVSEADANAFADGLGIDNFYLRGWKFNDVSCGERYTFAVSAYNHRGESAKTRLVSTVTPECDCSDADQSSVTFFGDALCRGDSIRVTEPMRVSLYNFNDETSSISIPSGWSVEVFENIDASDGSSMCMTESKWNLSYDRYWISDRIIDGTISNAEVFDSPNCGRQLPILACDAIDFDGVGLFDYTHCLGQDRLFYQPGFYNLPDFDNATTSIYIKPGWSVRVWEQNTRQGDFTCFNESKWDLSYDAYWNWDLSATPPWDSSRRTSNNITSVEVFNDSMCGGISSPDVWDPNEVYLVTDQSELTLKWEQLYLTGYWAELYGPNGFFRESGFLGENKWHIGTLPAGIFTLKVQGENLGQRGEWSTLEFVVTTTEPTQEMTVVYYITNPQMRLVRFNVANCPAGPIHVSFGDGQEIDITCQDGTATVDHPYAYEEGMVTYNAVVGDIAVPVTLGESDPNLKDCGEKPALSGVDLYATKDCKDDSRSFGSSGTYSLADFDNQASAIMVAPNWSVEVFEQTNSSDGHAYCVTRDIWDLSFESYYAIQGFTLNDNISVIRVYADSSCGKKLPQYGGCDANISYDGVVLFDYIHCGGEENAFNKPGRYEFGFGGPFEDKTSSVHIAPGWSLKVFQDSGWTGNVSCYANDMWDLGTDKYWSTEAIVGNTVSSVQVFDNAECRPDNIFSEDNLDVPDGLTPSGGVFDLGKNIMLRWNDVSGATLYKVEISGAEQDTVVKSGTEHVLRPTVTGTYSWKVKALNDGHEGEWSTMMYLTVRDPEDDHFIDPNPGDPGFGISDEFIYLPVIMK